MANENVPPGWMKFELGAIADIVGGGTPKASDPSNFAEPGEGVAWLTPADLSGYKDKYIGNGKRDISQKGYDSSSAKLMPKDSLLFTSRAPIGYVAIAANEIATNQGFKSIVFRESVDPSYAYYYLRSIKDLAQSRGTGTTFKELSGAATKKLPFLLPPLEEQIRIANKLDELLAQVDTIKARVDAIPYILKRFRQSVLAAAVSGRLTEEWRQENPGAWSHYAEIFETQLNSKPKPLTAEELEAASKASSGGLPDCWRHFALEQLVDGVRGIPYGIVQTGQQTEGGIPTVRCGDVGNLSIDTTQLKLVDSEVAGQYQRTVLRGGEVILAIRGTVGNAAVVPDSLSGCNISREVALIPVQDQMNPHFVAMLLQSPVGYSRVAEKVRGVAQKGINLADVRRLVTPVPPIAEQDEIVRVVHDLFDLADLIEQRLSDARFRTDSLTESILAKAFRGELIPQNPGDEPASALLERINATRVVEKTRKKTRSVTTNPTRNATMTKSRFDIDVRHKAYLAKILRDSAPHQSVDALFQKSQLTIDDFYKQLCWEVDIGHIKEAGTRLEAAE